MRGKRFTIKQGLIDYYDITKIIGDFGVKFNLLKKVKNAGGKLALSSQMFTNLVNEMEKHLKLIIH